MQNFKNKLYNYETPPPEEIWQHINEELQNEKVVKIPGHKRSKNFYYLAVAAASLVIIFIGSIFFKKNNNESNSSGFVINSKAISAEKKDSMVLNHKMLESIINSPKEKHEIVLNDFKDANLPKKYITVAGPEGQPVKISPKVATLIIAADNEFPPKPIWNKKVDKWQKIMLSSTISPTSAGLADLIQNVSEVN